MKISDFPFHDATIQEVREYPEQQRLEIYIDFPVDWKNNQFEFRKMVFTGITYYCVNGFPFAGNPAILEIHELIDTVTNKIELDTNAGKRIIEYRSFYLTT